MGQETGEITIIYQFSTHFNFHLEKLSLLLPTKDVSSVPGERDGGDGYHGQGESAGGPRHAGHHLQLPGPSVCEDRETSVNVCICILNDNESLLTFLH